MNQHSDEVGNPKRADAESKAGEFNFEGDRGGTGKLGIECRNLEYEILDHKKQTERKKSGEAKRCGVDRRE